MPNLQHLPLAAVPTAGNWNIAASDLTTGHNLTYVAWNANVGRFANVAGFAYTNGANGPVEFVFAGTMVNTSVGNVCVDITETFIRPMFAQPAATLDASADGSANEWLADSGSNYTFEQVIDDAAKLNGYAVLLGGTFVAFYRGTGATADLCQQC